MLFFLKEISTDAWIRLAIEPGDLLVLPPGMYHRFTLDEGDRIVAMILSRVRYSLSLWSWHVFFYFLLGNSGGTWNERLSPEKSWDWGWPNSYSISQQYDSSWSGSVNGVCVLTMLQLATIQSIYFQLKNPSRIAWVCIMVLQVTTY